ncbi:MAG: DUF4190 domain-containing protein [Planctomycetales bacterium]
MSIIGVFTCGTTSVLGLIFSLVGLKTEPKGTAVAGTILGGIGTVGIMVAFLFFGAAISALIFGASAIGGAIANEMAFDSAVTERLRTDLNQPFLEVRTSSTNTNDTTRSFEGEAKGTTDAGEPVGYRFSGTAEKQGEEWVVTDVTHTEAPVEELTRFLKFDDMDDESPDSGDGLGEAGDGIDEPKDGLNDESNDESNGAQEP